MSKRMNFQSIKNLKQNLSGSIRRVSLVNWIYGSISAY